MRQDERVHEEDWAEQRRECEARMHILEAVAAAVNRREELLTLVAEATDVDAAVVAVRKLLNTDEVAAEAVVDLQVRRFATSQRAKIQEQLLGLRAQLMSLNERSDI